MRRLLAALSAVVLLPFASSADAASDWAKLWKAPPAGTRTYIVRLTKDYEITGDLPLFWIDLTNNSSAWLGVNIILDGNGHNLIVGSGSTDDNEPALAIAMGSNKFESLAVDTTADTIQVRSGHRYESNDTVYFTSSATGPSPLVMNTTPYYVITTADPEKFQVSATSGPGSAVNLTSGGSAAPDFHKVLAGAEPASIRITNLGIRNRSTLSNLTGILLNGPSFAFNEIDNVRIGVVDYFYEPSAGIARGVEVGDAGAKLTVRDSSVTGVYESMPTVQNGIWDIVIHDNTMFGDCVNFTNPDSDLTFSYSIKSSANQYWQCNRILVSGFLFVSSGDMFEDLGIGDANRNTRAYFTVGDATLTGTPSSGLNVTGAHIRSGNADGAFGLDYRELIEFAEFESIKLHATFNNMARDAEGDCPTSNFMGANGKLLDASTTALIKGDIDIDLQTYRDQDGADKGKICFPEATCNTSFQCPTILSANAQTACSQATPMGWCTGEIKIGGLGQWRLNGAQLEMHPGWFTFSAETGGTALSTGDEFCDTGHDESGTLFVEDPSGLSCRKAINASTGAALACNASMTDETYYKVLCD